MKSVCRIMRAMTSAIEFPALVIGLMSGTSADGVDAALLRTDGRDLAKPLAHAHIRYSDDLRHQILRLMRGEGDRASVAQALTVVHRDAIAVVMNAGKIQARDDVSLIGFHGQTITHDPG